MEQVTLKLNEHAERAVHALQSALGGNEDTIAAVASKSGAPIYSYSLPGDRVSGCGRMMIKRDGGILVWHRTMLRPWLPAPFEQKEVAGTNGRGPMPAHQISLEMFESLEPGCFARVRQHSQANLSRQAAQATAAPASHPSSSPSTAAAAATLLRPSQPPPSSEAKLATVQATWMRMQEHLLQCPATHRHLNKGPAAP